MTSYRRTSPGEPFDVGFAAIYEELRRLAASQLRGGGHTLRPTELVHEAYLRCSKQQPPRDPGHLRATLVTAMRHVLVDHCRRRASRKRGGSLLRTQCAVDEIAAGPVDVLHLDELLSALAAANPRMARIAELRVIGGMTLDEVAAELQLSVSAIGKEWQFAKAWLARQLCDPVNPPAARPRPDTP